MGHDFFFVRHVVYKRIKKIFLLHLTILLIFGVSNLNQEY